MPPPSAWPQGKVNTHRGTRSIGALERRQKVVQLRKQRLQQEQQEIAELAPSRARLRRSRSRSRERPDPPKSPRAAQPALSGTRLPELPLLLSRRVNEANSFNRATSQDHGAVCTAARRDQAGPPADAKCASRGPSPNRRTPERTRCSPRRASPSARCRRRRSGSRPRPRSESRSGRAVRTEFGRRERIYQSPELQRKREPVVNVRIQVPQLRRECDSRHQDADRLGNRAARTDHPTHFARSHSPEPSRRGNPETNIHSARATRRRRSARDPPELYSSGVQGARGVASFDTPVRPPQRRQAEDDSFESPSPEQVRSQRLVSEVWNVG